MGLGFIEHLHSNKSSCLSLPVSKDNNHAPMCTMKQIWDSYEDTWSTLCEFLEKEGNAMTQVLVPHFFQWWLKWQGELRADCSNGGLIEMMGSVLIRFSLCLSQ